MNFKKIHNTQLQQIMMPRVQT